MSIIQFGYKFIFAVKLAVGFTIFIVFIIALTILDRLDNILGKNKNKNND